MNIQQTLQHAYGFDDVAIAPGEITINPDLVYTSVDIGATSLRIPFIASAMDSVVDPSFAAAISQVGGMAVLNLDGLHTRYQDTTAAYAEIAQANGTEATSVMQKLYSVEVKPNLIGERVEEIIRLGGIPAVSLVPANAKRLAPLAAEAGAEWILIQSTVTTGRHKSRSPRGLILSEFVKKISKPVIVGNTVSYSVTRELMENGVSGVLVGVGPGAACTSREVLGVGMPQITATLECSAARDEYLRESKRYVPIITDGGIRTGGDVCKAVAAGADAVMIGSPFAKTYEAPGQGFHWGMATPHASLPRGTRLNLGQHYSLEQLLLGPSSKTDGTQNLAGALRISMGMIGAHNVREMHSARLVYAPAIKHEGKAYQEAGRNAL